MYKLDGYMAGANLGHWISQYGKAGASHWDTYITEPDFARMKEWGFDHVRLPVDYFIFESEENPGVYDENTLKYIDFAISSCKKYGLNLVLDLHHAPGFFFGDGDKNNLFTDAYQQKRFIDIWKFFSHRYADEGDNVIFELLNELVWEHSGPWNELWQRTAEEILKITPHRRIIVGGNYWNSVTQLKHLTVSPSDRIIYTFHCYEPFIFTHQRANWIEKMKRYPNPIDYPVDYKQHASFFYPGNECPEEYYKYDKIGKDFLIEYYSPARDFIEKNKRPVYCGEYGVIAYAPVPSSIKWYNDVADVFNSWGIGRAVWSYRGFSRVTDENNRMFDPEIIKAVTRKD